MADEAAYGNTKNTNDTVNAGTLRDSSTGLQFSVTITGISHAYRGHVVLATVEQANTAEQSGSGSQRPAEIRLKCMRSPVLYILYTSASLSCAHHTKYFLLTTANAAGR